MFSFIFILLLPAARRARRVYYYVTNEETEVQRRPVICLIQVVMGRVGLESRPLWPQRCFQRNVKPCKKHWKEPKADEETPSSRTWGEKAYVWVLALPVRIGAPLCYHRNLCQRWLCLLPCSFGGLISLLICLPILPVNKSLQACALAFFFCLCSNHGE